MMKKVRFYPVYRVLLLVCISLCSAGFAHAALSIKIADLLSKQAELEKRLEAIETSLQSADSMTQERLKGTIDELINDGELLWKPLEQRTYDPSDPNQYLIRDVIGYTD